MRQGLGIEANGIRQPHADRNGSIGEAQIRGQLSQPVAGELFRNLLRAEPVARGGQRVDRPRHLGVAALRSDDIDNAIDSVQCFLNGPGQFGEALGIVAEDLHFNRLGAAFEIAEHVLQQLHELDFDKWSRLVHALSKVADDFLRGAAALTAGLEADQDVAAVLRRREKPQLGSGAPRVRGDLRRIGDNALDEPYLAIGLDECTAFRGQVIEDEPTLVGRWEESGPDAREQTECQDQQQNADRHRNRRAADHHAQQTFVHLLECAVPFAGRPMMRSGPACHERHDADGQREGDENGHRKGERERLEELSRHAGEQAERDKHDHRRQRGADERFGDLRHRAQHGLAAFTRSSMDVLHDHHRIVDDEADGDGKPAERHQVDRSAEEPHERECGDDGHRQRHGRNEGEPPIAQEHEEDRDREQASNQNGVSHARN